MVRQEEKKNTTANKSTIVFQYIQVRSIPMALVSWYLPPSIAFYIQKYGAVYLFVTVIVGFFANGFIVLITFRSRYLRSPCNILIAIQAAMDILTSFGHLVYFYFLYTETLIPFSQCYFYQFIPCSAMNITTALMLAIGLDRFLCLKYAVKYKTWPVKIYTSMVLTACVLYDALIKLVGYATLTDDPVICLIADGYVGLGKDTWVGTQVLINCAVVFVYKNIRSEMKLLEDDGKEAKKLVRSLYTIVLFYTFGWLMTMCLLGVLRVLTTEYGSFKAKATVYFRPNLVVTCELFAGVFANVNMVIPAFVYYQRSTVYNMAFKRFFRGGKVGTASGSYAVASTGRSAYIYKG
uniref:G_PROTEIN_RECEP_F1_2 domain-containing protein n=1 Tax=Steinernema glaseri TaxID=37863 RepID=A0A1I7ZCM6_9BILA